MKSFFQKIPKIFYYLPWIIAFILYSFPWYRPIEIKANKHADVHLTLERTDSTQFSIIESLSPDQSVFLRGVKIVAFKSSADLLFLSDHKPIIPDNFSSITPPSARNRLKVIVALVWFSLLMTYLIWLLSQFYKFTDKKILIKTLVCFSGHAGVLLFFLLTNKPGLFSIDIFFNYWGAADQDFNYFVGYFYSMFLMIAYQVFPSAYLVPVSNIVIICVVLSGLYLFCLRRNLLTYYFLSIAIFYIYPVHLPLSLYGSRDIFANWLLCGTLLYCYQYFYEKNQATKTTFSLVLLIAISCLNRQENIYILVPGMIFFCFRYRKELFIKAVTSSIVLVSAVFIFNNQFEREKIKYETTLLINPLSSILYRLYGESLPSEIDRRLGHFFKNDYLVKDFYENDINPFHFGGMNQDFKIDDYKQFKRETFKIILENPILFLKNRLFILQHSMGFFFHDHWFITHVYEKNPFAKETIRKLGFPKEERGYLYKLRDFAAMNPGIITASYLIPIIIITMLCIISSKNSVFSSMALLLAFRTSLVFISAPASYFKYHYILWLFALFSLPFALYERRTSLTKSTPGLKTQ